MVFNYRLYSDSGVGSTLGNTCLHSSTGRWHTRSRLRKQNRIKIVLPFKEASSGPIVLSRTTSTVSYQHHIATWTITAKLLFAQTMHLRLQYLMYKLAPNYLLKTNLDYILPPLINLHFIVILVIYIFIFMRNTETLYHKVQKRFQQVSILLVITLNDYGKLIDAKISAQSQP